jgi:hypothetical protein
MVAAAFVMGACGLAMCFLAVPLYIKEIRKFLFGPEYVPLKVIGAAVLLAWGLTLLGVTAWRLLTL